MATGAAYQEGPNYSKSQIEDKHRNLSRILRKISTYSEDPIVSAFHITFFYQMVIPTWFESRQLWSLPVHTALPVILDEEPQFYECLYTMVYGTLTERIKACELALSLLLTY